MTYADLAGGGSPRSPLWRRREREVWSIPCYTSVPEAPECWGSQGGRLYLHLTWESGGTRPGPEGGARPPGGRGGRGEDCSGRSLPQTPYAGQMRDLAALVPQLEVERGPAARLRKTILGAFSGVGLKSDPSLL